MATKANENADPVPAPERMPYTLTLTTDEYRTLGWLGHRGYCADLDTLAREIDTETTPGTVVLKYREIDAWQVHDLYDEDVHAFGACAGPELLRKMYNFLERIV